MDFNLAQVFSDPEGQILTYNTQSSSSTIATLDITGSVMKVSPKAVGSTIIFMKATDPYGESVTTQFILAVIPANEQPIVKAPLLALGLKITDGKKDSIALQMTDYFSDPNEDILTFSISTSLSGVITYKMIGTMLLLYASQAGNTKILINAKDPENLSVSQEFIATVSIFTGIENADQMSFTLSPNPTSKSALIEYYLHTEAFVNLDVYDLAGRKLSTLVEKHQTQGEHKAEYTTDTVSNGTYLVILRADSKVLVQRMLVIK